MIFSGLGSETTACCRAPGFNHEMTSPLMLGAEGGRLQLRWPQAFCGKSLSSGKQGDPGNRQLAWRGIGKSSPGGLGLCASPEVQICAVCSATRCLWPPDVCDVASANEGLNFKQ